MKQILPLLLVGCVSPPAVESITPTTATYGSIVTINGSGFGTKGAVTFTQPAETVTSDLVIEHWSDSQIIARVPFPTTAGPIHIEAANGDCDSPDFTPLTPWGTGEPIVMPTLLEAKPVPNGAAVLGLDGDQHLVLATLIGGTATVTPLDGIRGSTDDRTPTAARLVIDATGKPIVFATSIEGQVLEIVDGVATNSLIAATVMAAGVDATGPYAWVDNGHSLSRVRPGPPFAADRGPFDDENALDMEIASDGTLIAARGVDAGILFDNEAYLGIARLAPSATAFVLGENTEVMAWDDYIAAARLQISPDGTQMFARYSTQEYDETVDHPRPPDQRNVAGAWSIGDGILDGHQPIAFVGATIAALDGRDAIALVRDIGSAASEPLPLWPAAPAALLVDGDGTTLRPLIRINDQLWYPMP